MKNLIEYINEGDYSREIEEFNKKIEDCGKRFISNLANHRSLKDIENELYQLTKERKELLNKIHNSSDKQKINSTGEINTNKIESFIKKFNYSYSKYSNDFFQDSNNEETRKKFKDLMQIRNFVVLKYHKKYPELDDKLYGIKIFK